MATAEKQTLTKTSERRPRNPHERIAISIAETGALLKIISVLLYYVFGIWSLVLELIIVFHAWGYLGLWVAIIIFPATFVAAPFYALFAWHNWWPLIIGYGGYGVSYGIYLVGKRISGED
jgi:hypothetical protein